ncbi:MAG: hypothetical protein ACJA2G_002701 [Cognaticolwellia sp.]|jgi:hypothetical protein
MLKCFYTIFQTAQDIRFDHLGSDTKKEQGCFKQPHIKKFSALTF